MTPNTWTTSSACSGGDCLEAQYKTSSFCAAGNCLEAAYRTSSFSYGLGECVEVALPQDVVLVRDTKDRTRPPAEVTPAAWAAFVAGVRGREFEVDA